MILLHFLSALSFTALTNELVTWSPGMTDAVSSQEATRSTLILKEKDGTTFSFTIKFSLGT